MLSMYEFVELSEVNHPRNLGEILLIYVELPFFSSKKKRVITFIHITTHTPIWITDSTMQTPLVNGLYSIQTSHPLL